jgi:hypothetical protein
MVEVRNATPEPDGSFRTPAEIANHYQTTEEMARFRLNATGAARQARTRRAARAGARP